MSLKLTEILEPFSGEGDIVEWLKKVKLVVKLQKIGKLNCIVPLLLRGNAFSVYDQMKDEDKENEEKIEEALVNAFSIGRFTAYASFINRRFNLFEPVDVFLSDLKRLASLAKMTNDDVILNAFVCGFDANISCQLRSLQQKNKSDVNELAEQARILVTEMSSSSNSFVASGKTITNISDKSQKQSFKCFRCGRNGHVARFCRNSIQEEGTEKLNKLKCFNCQEEGHLARACPKNKCQLCNNTGHGAKMCPGN